MTPRQEAAAAGQRHYLSSKPCRRGHVAPRRVSDGRCTQCWEEKAFPSQKKYREYSARWREKFPGREQEVKYRYRYGVELSEIRAKPPVCEICSRPHKKIVFDHCHVSGKFRGWICDPCNIALGNVGDSIETLEKMIAYLKGNPNKDITVQSNGIREG